MKLTLSTTDIGVIQETVSVDDFAEADFQAREWLLVNDLREANYNVDFNGVQSFSANGFTVTLDYALDTV